LVYETIKQGLNELFDLRNRLAHFKDDPEVLNLNSAPESLDGTEIRGFSDVAKIIPIPDLDKRLMWPSTQRFVSTVKQASEWLTKLQKYYEENHKVKSQTLKVDEDKWRSIKPQQAAEADRPQSGLPLSFPLDGEGIE
jgi:hypothetical protein